MREGKSCVCGTVVVLSLPPFFLLKWEGMMFSSQNPSTVKDLVGRIREVR